MFKIKYRKNGLNSEKRSVANLSKRVFLCEEIKYSDKFQDLDIRVNRNLLNSKIDYNVDMNAVSIDSTENGTGQSFGGSVEIGDNDEDDDDDRKVYLDDD